MWPRSRVAHVRGLAPAHVWTPLTHPPTLWVLQNNRRHYQLFVADLHAVEGEEPPVQDKDALDLNEMLICKCTPSPLLPLPPSRPRSLCGGVANLPRSIGGARTMKKLRAKTAWVGLPRLRHPGLKLLGSTCLGEETQG